MKHTFSRRVIARTVAARLRNEPARREYWMRALAAFLVDERREHEAELILSDIAHELHLQQGHLAVTLTSARPLTHDARESLRQSLAASTGARHVELQEKVDPSLLGGVIARTPDAVLDLSVRSKLNRLATIT